MTSAADSNPNVAGSSEPPLSGLAATFETWPGPVIEVMRDGSVAQANEAGRALVPEVLVGEDSDMRKMVSLAFDAGGSVSDRLEVIRDDKSSWYECVILPLAVDRALVLVRDETYNLNVRQALFESRQRYRDLVVISSDFAWETDANGVFIFVSPHGAMGYSAEDLVGHHPIEFVIDTEVDRSELPYSTREIGRAHV